MLKLVNYINYDHLFFYSKAKPHLKGICLPSVLHDHLWFHCFC